MKKASILLSALALVASSCASDPLQKKVDEVYSRLSLEVIIRKLGSESLMTSYNKFRDEYFALASVK